MKKHFCLPGLLAAALLLLPGCSGSAEPKPEIAPYAFTEETQFVLEILGMADTAALFTFQGPEDPIPDKAAKAHVMGADIYLPLAGLIDLDKEIARIEKEIANTENELKRLAGKLSNESFVAKAPAEVVEKERAKQGMYEEKLSSLRQHLQMLS